MGDELPIFRLDERVDRRPRHQLQAAKALEPGQGAADADNVKLAPVRCSVSMSADMRLTEPVISGVIRWLKALKRRTAVFPSWIWSMSLGATVASMASASCRAAVRADLGSETELERGGSLGDRAKGARHGGSLIAVGTGFGTEPASGLMCALGRWKECIMPQ